MPVAATHPAIRTAREPPGPSPQFSSANLMSQQHSVVIHAHCYQPPREDPWLEVVETEPSAHPDHDWNARINRECYEQLGAVEIRAKDKRAAQRDPDARSGISRLINLYAWCSFDAGATLCEWLQQEAPDTMRLMVEGDAASVKRLGYGNAIAAPYHHVILPLASRRDKITEVRWGLRDFRQRFGRDAQGMWLPECAVDEETLDVLAQEGVQFTILAPYQIRGASGDGMPVRWNASGGKSIAILPYDGSLAGEVAFGNLLQYPDALANRLAPVAFNGERSGCTTLATDGETFGHHHRGGDIGLAQALQIVQGRSNSRVTNAAALIAESAPQTLIELVSPSSWSCAHGVERWRSDCGCRLDSNANTSQRWRRPLRESMNWLANSCHDVFEGEGTTLFADDPWSVRDRYGSVVASDGAALTEFARSECRAPDNPEAVQRAQELLELERAVLRTFTSCAWFFDDVARIETRQVLRYAARALELSNASGSSSTGIADGSRRGRKQCEGTRNGRRSLFARSDSRHSNTGKSSGRRNSTAKHRSNERTHRELRCLV
jgi:alpha-amylase/alpha-mannosidase (GH57 family)